MTTRQKVPDTPSWDDHSKTEGTRHDLGDEELDLSVKGIKEEKKTEIKEILRKRIHYLKKMRRRNDGGEKREEGGGREEGGERREEVE
ncbi:hypothetical protein ACHWQZ_G000497 [Mnemiopsis leidyi]